jgi:YccS/YhfK family integral membrane protein
LTPKSSVFRHALRLTVALVAGYGIKSLIHPTLGYWILLTTLFVCQPNYSSTRQRFWQRIAGTVLGLVAGWALITLFPEPRIQRLIAVAAGVVFFAYRGGRYTLATGAITLMVVCCFNQVVDGYGILWPRLIDTLIGSLLSGFAVFFILPDWHSRQIHRVVAAPLAASGRYLRRLMRQYDTGKRDDLAYRVARREAHNADAALSTTLSNMLQEPGPFRKDAELCLLILVRSHTVLSYLSALGAHRGSLPAEPWHDQISRAADHIATALGAIAADLADRRPVAVSDERETALAKELRRVPDQIDDQSRLVWTQLSLICQQLAPMRLLAAQLQQNAAARS